MNEPLNNLSLARLFDQLIDADELDALIDVAHREDMGPRGDVTSTLLIDAEAMGMARIVARQAGRLAGAAVLGRIAARYDAALRVTLRRADGDTLTAGAIIAEVRGPMRALLAAERVMLNMLTYLSGIATLTAQYVHAVADTAAKIYDTRKTAPGLRALSKYAVRCGGGYGHRIGLYDAVLVKDNHVAGLVGGAMRSRIEQAVKQARQFEPQPAFIEVEVDDLDQLHHVLGCGVDIVLLDNMTTQQMQQAVAMRGEMRRTVKLEASGGVTLQTVRSIAETGVDRIAVGALTHSAPALDIGMDIEP